MAAGPSHGSITEAWYSHMARTSSARSVDGSFQAGGTSIVTACSSDRPDITSSSSAASSLAESDQRSSAMG